MKIKNIYLTAALTLLSSSIQANPYISSSIGKTDDGDLTSTSYSLAAGYKFNQQFALEASYEDLGSYSEDIYDDGDIANFNIDGLGLHLVGFMPIANNIDLFAKVGMVNWELESSYMGLNGSIDGTDLSYGFGASYMLNDTSSLKLELDRISLDVDGETANLNTVSFGVTFSF
jgi:OmpA-OmpF porin, OOP family